MLWPLLLCSVASLLVILQLLYTYGDRKRCAWYVQLAAVTSWYLPFTIVFILPFDFSSTLYRKCEQNCDEPMGYIGGHFTRNLWIVLYWVMYMLTWLVLPIMMSYVDSGAFTFKDRLRESAWSNLQFYGISGIVGLVVIGYIALTRKYLGADLIAFLMALANFWGLFLVITFMGFGLVSIPRKLWRRGDLALELSKIESRAVAFKDKAYDSALELAETIKEAQLVSSRVNSVDDLRHCVDQILKHCPPLSESSGLPTQNLMMSSRVPTDITETYLAGLHNRIKHAVLKEERDRWRWNRSAHRAFFLQDAIQSRGNASRQINSSLAPWCHWGIAKRSAAWWWYIVIRPLVYRALTVAAAMLSATILWSELTFNLASSHLSIVRHLLRAMDLSYFAIEGTSIVIIAYMCLCAYSSVMKLRIFNIYSLESHHHTNERSLLFCGAYLCRLMFPLCYNFLNMAGSGFAIGGDDSSGEVTEFAKFMDQIDLVPVLGEQSNRAIPLLVMVPAALALFNVHGRVMEYFSIDRVTAASQSADDQDEELGPLCLPHEEGRGLLVEVRLAAERQQGVHADNYINTRHYSPAGSTYSNSANHRTHTLSAGSANDQTGVNGRGHHEWYLGRSSFENTQDDVASDLPHENTTISALGDLSAHHHNSRRPFGNYSSNTDLAGIVNGGGSSSSSNSISNNGNNVNAELHGDSGDFNGSDNNGFANYSSNPLSPQGAPRPTGMAARFGRWLPTRPTPQLPRTRSKHNGSGRPSNVTRLRPSSRQSSRNNYASDDGMYPANMYSSRSGGEGSLTSAGRGGNTQARLNQHLLLSPSSPGRMPNPWADTVDARSQTRRHALSDSSLRAFRDTSGKTPHQG
ncbi:hypothetical protein GGI25_005219 [Coemansia spiralis]|uniref:LMBR1-like membrane protein n=2 Tax=Coemansia TaxID=4863 RepID=A0A9W8FZ12_9FUNG|nr:hypothetical protein EDC05_000855 [Coemansia umbellata]KAJ2625052.1 hypothetical protein GGI26_000855 [Coemansia sp. RSA 1358]KAJ2672187.1 hypothetical protein GGI25_005219 [Coemansia spiralis]